MDYLTKTMLGLLQEIVDQLAKLNEQIAAQKVKDKDAK